ncbi:putative ribonuclease H-like domain-containing protein [Tanacetum coccineum]
MPSRHDLSFAGLDDYVYKTNVSETITNVPRNESTASKSSKDNLKQPKDVRPNALIIEEWESDSDDDCVIRPSFEQNKPRVDKEIGMDYDSDIGGWFGFNKKACFVCESLNHLIKDCNFYENKMVGKSMLNNMGRVTGQREVRPVWNNAQRFCGMKEIKREFSVARTPQQNRVAEKKNRTLIEAARTMLADSLLPIRFWAEAVNTTCYVQNTEKEGKASNKVDDQHVHDFRTKLGSLLVQQKEGYANNTNRDSTAHPSVSTARPSINTASKNINTGSPNINTASPIPNDLSMQSLENTGIFDDAYDDREVGAKAGLNNLETNMNVSPIATTRIHKDNPIDQIIGDINSATQTRRMTKIFEEHAMMDVKSAFLYGTIEEEVYVCQPPGFEDLHFPNKEYKVKKLYMVYIKLLEPVHVYVDDIIFGSTKKSLCDEFEGLMHKRFQMSSMGELTFFLGLQVQQKEDGIFISQDKYVAEILKKFDFATVKTASTPIETNKALVKDEEAEAVDVHLYRSMIGSLMYLTASRPDIMFAVCACARFQVTPKTSHIHVVKRIFRYLKGQPKLGLWYPRDSPFDLEAFSDSDYVGASLDRKSTTGGCQFLGKRLISWQCKKQTIVANSTTEAEFEVKTGSCKVNTTWQKISTARQKLVLLSQNETVYKEWEDRMKRAATTASSLDEALKQLIKAAASVSVTFPIFRSSDISLDGSRDGYRWNEKEIMPPRRRLKKVSVKRSGGGNNGYAGRNCECAGLFRTRLSEWKMLIPLKN